MDLDNGHTVTVPLPHLPMFYLLSFIFFLLDSPVFTVLVFTFWILTSWVCTVLAFSMLTILSRIVILALVGHSVDEYFYHPQMVLEPLKTFTLFAFVSLIPPNTLLMSLCKLFLLKVD